MRSHRKIDAELLHDLREGLTLNKGWLEILIRDYDKLDDKRRKEMLAGALYGANQLAFVLDMLDGAEPSQVENPSERMASDLLRLSE